MVLGASRIDGLADLVEVCRGEPSDVQALERACGLLRGVLDAERVDLAAMTAAHAEGRAASRLSTGPGPPTTLVGRVLRSGASVGPLPVAGGGEEAGVVVRFGGLPTAALVVRWRRAPGDAERWLSGAATIVAGRADGWRHALREASAADSQVPGLLGGSPAMRAVREAVVRAAPAPFAVLVCGESGVGKELIARALHTLSPRRTQRFCDLNCAALPDELVESELFGHARGAFTGATAERAGLFEEANGGTVFLDEVVDLSLRAQAKLLRVLQQQEVRRIGDARPRPLDVRVVSAANRDPRGEAAAGGVPRRSRLPPRRDSHRRAAAARATRGRARTGRPFLARGGRARGFARDARPRRAVAARGVRLAGQRARAAERARRRGRRARRARAGWACGTFPRTCAPRPHPEAPQRLEDARRESDRVAVRAALQRAGGHRGQAARELGAVASGTAEADGAVWAWPVRSTPGGRRISPWPRFSRAGSRCRFRSSSAWRRWSSPSST